MPLTDEQVKYVKEQLLKQAESFPEDKREQVKKYILSMNNEQVEQFIAKNQLMSKQESAQGRAEQEDDDDEDSDSSAEKKKSSQCVYCLISAKQIESLPIYEDKDYIAVLEINPFSQGHTVLIPKKHISEAKLLKSKAFTIANKIGKHLVKQLKAENFQITTSDDLKHAIVNIIPRQKGEAATFERKPADKKQLQELAMKIGAIKKRDKVIKIKSENSGENPKIDEEKAKSALIHLPRRIP